MTKAFILKAENQKDIEKIAKPFLDNGFKVISEDKNYLIAKKRNFGSYYIHFIFIVLILFVISSWVLYVACGIYIAYFLYFLFTKSKVVLITTETTDKDGNLVEFDDIENIVIN